MSVIYLAEMMTPVEKGLSFTSTVREALCYMQQTRLDTVPVMDSEGKLAGVFTRSRLYGLLLDGLSLDDVIGPYVRTDNLVALPINISPEELEEIIRHSQVGAGVVVDEQERVTGVLTRTGIVNALLRSTRSIKELATELEKVKQLESLLTTVIEHAYDGIVLVDQDGLITFMNSALTELFGIDPKACLGQHISHALPQLGLGTVLSTKEASWSKLLEFRGIKYLVHRVPVMQQGHLIGAIGKVIYRHLSEVKHVLRQYEFKSSRASCEEKRSRFSFKDIISGNEQMLRLKRSVKKAARSDSTVLIRGESGTGKELFAHAIHEASFRREAPFVVINCAAIPEHLLESEFFGYAEGAFTGAKSKGKLGKFDLADGGTLFLDEVGDMSPSLQAKLLRVLQEREFYRVGGTEVIKVDVRIIAATNRPLEQMVEEGSFRRDLYYRLNVISVDIPPLRERKEDIPLLCEKLIPRLNRKLGTSIVSIDPAVMEILLAYDWPGNVRELENVLERSMTFAEHGQVTVEDLPDYIVRKVAHDPSGQAVKDQSHRDMGLLAQKEQEAIRQALKQTKGNKTKAAQLLGISRSVLYDKLKRFSL
ncbi:sigma-54-dependent Fis family transcriptional regulator [Caldalkalibacillus thermarum]|uniref:sigma-54-dependent Fis family transcriptional regulator n=1 Tax=Caldalkalibacillus thermarum TaxID=296745 RepID=UPI001ED96A91|nr:sigma-54-dependent Fis family transcriptional regulator [Caldalkalibacillus thermarum]